MNVALLLCLLAVLSIAGAPAQPATEGGPRPARAGSRPARGPADRAAERRRLELRFPRALEPLRWQAPSRPGGEPALDQPPSGTHSTRQPGFPGRLRMPGDLQRSPAIDRMPPVTVPQEPGWRRMAGRAARLARPLAGAGLLALALAGAWRAWRRRAHAG